MNVFTTRKAVLYQNATATVTLIDVPSSIAFAQGTWDKPNVDILISSPPLRTPYISAEPKSEAKRAKMLQQADSEDEILRQQLTAQISDALLELKEKHNGDWFLPRKFTAETPSRQAKKRKFNEGGMSDPDALKSDGQGAELGQTATREALKAETAAIARIPLDLSLAKSLGPVSSPPSVPVYNAATLAGRLVVNPTLSSLDLCLSASHTYRIPPFSSFCVVDINPETASALAETARSLHPSPSVSADVGQFDFIILDPPWVNRSVRRSRSYKSSEDLDPLNTLQEMLGNHIAPQGLVGIWITNKAKVRLQALKLFAEWGVELVEQWVWIKTTTEGAPVTKLDGIWRKPYEIFLIGKRGDKVSDGDDYCKYQCWERVVRRTIVGVPDVHSRKPNLRELIQPLMNDFKHHRVLEIFARSLTAGWCAWGNEVLKFNTDIYWSRAE